MIGPVFPRKKRTGVVLLVVITLLTLFAVVGITFVLFSQSEAIAARVWRESETLQRPDMDPEMLLSYFLSQLIYDTNNPNSALRGHGLARNMYGKPGSNVPFNGTGRVHTNANPAQDDYYQVDYTNYAGGPVRNPDQVGSPNAPYTYPDYNNMYLGAIRASDGVVLIPSYSRVNPQQGQPRITLRPSTTYHTTFPPMEDAGGDVKNLADSAGTLIDPTQGTLAYNDSIWIDLGFPVMKAPDGRKFKPLFAPLILDLDNRVNVNVHGNRNGWGYPTSPWTWCGAAQQYCTSWQGYGPWEVNLEKVLTATDSNSGIEARNIFVGKNGVQGRYDPNLYLQAPNASTGFALPPEARITGKFYTQTDINAHLPSPGHILLPGSPTFTDCWGSQTPQCPATTPFPMFTVAHNCDNFYTWFNEFPYPSYYNYFDPSGWTSYSKYGWAPKDRRFGPSHMEALLRYGDTGSPALTSDLFRLCSNSLASAKTRKLITTNSFDVDRPGIYPWVWDPTAQPYTLNAGSPYPTGNAIPFPAPGNAPPANSEFSPNWQAVTAALGRIDLNRKLPDYPAPDANSLQITDMANFNLAQQARQQLAKDIFTCLWQVTGAGNPTNATANTPNYNALRWLAQLAVNMVDYIDNDDYMTPFNWNGNDWVFGTELPRLVLNEAYAELDNDPADTGPKATKPYQLNFWVELSNPFNNTQSGDFPPMTDNGAARLQTPGGTAIYQLVIAQTPNNNLRGASNVLGTEDNGQRKALVSSFTAAMGFTPQNGVDVTMVNTLDLNTSCQAGFNNGFYVLGGKATLPGTGANLPPVTLQPQSNTMQSPAQGMTYLPWATLQSPFPNAIPSHALLLQRLACPNMPAQTNPAQPNYNPYITIDYMDQVPAYDGVAFDDQGKHTSTTPNNYYSVGRNQPYAADISQRNNQNANPAPANQPNNTFFQINAPVVNPFDWLVFMDRPVIGPMEMLQVSGFKPHELTQQFMTGGMNQQTGKANSRFAHRAPWYDQAARINRLFEFLEADFRLQGVTVGGRVPGKVNINTVWDLETLQALTDVQTNNYFAQVNNYFQENDVTTLFQQMLVQRSPGTIPGPSDRPFRGYATAYAPPNDQQYPQGSGIQDTLFTADTSANAPQGKRLFEYNAPQYLNDNPYMKSEIMNKMFHRLTTRSNVFALWLTVGFFEVLDDSDPARPPKLGREIGRSENRHVRHRMFAILDRTNLTFNPTNPQTPGATPFFMDVLSSVAAPGQATITLPAVSGKYEDMPFNIQVGDQLLIDVGSNQETITVTGVNAAAQSITATFAKAHQSVGVAITNVGGTTQIGNPGPQQCFDPRNPTYRAIVRYFSIVQ
jgi:hypothetical protein